MLNDTAVRRRFSALGKEIPPPGQQTPRVFAVIAAKIE